MARRPGFLLVHQVNGATYQSRAMIHPSGIAVTVMTYDATAESGTFDERRVGLDHLAFRVVDRDELQRWAAHFDAMGVTHTGTIDTGYGPTLVFRDPTTCRSNSMFSRSAATCRI